MQLIKICAHIYFHGFHARTHHNVYIDTYLEILIFDKFQQSLTMPSNKRIMLKEVNRLANSLPAVCLIQSVPGILETAVRLTKSSPVSSETASSLIRSAPESPPETQ